MGHSGVSFFSAFSVFFIISLGVIIILWIQVPFSAFKSRQLLEEIKKEQEETNRLLALIASEKSSESSEALVDRPAAPAKIDAPDKKETAD